MFKSEAEVNLIKELYPKGTKIKLEYMDDIQSPPIGTVGEVVCVDSIGQIHMKWENGSSLALNVDVDKFQKI